MWKWLFRTSEDEAEIPKPEWPPIQNVESIDVIGHKDDGGVDLIIVASQPLGDSPRTLRVLREKVRSYLDWVDDPDFVTGLNHPPRDKTTIVLSCDHPIHEAAQAVIEECKQLAAEQGIRLEVRQSAISIGDEIVSARRCGVTHCGISKQGCPSLAQLAKEFGLADDPDIYHEVDAAEARKIVQYVLQYDLAYHGGNMKPARAAHLADLFLSQFGNDGVTYFTNGWLHEGSGGWTPATEATFDAGVLVIGPTNSGCLWVEDED
jgi:hypothetical protein